jgi:hypothetical protein
MRYSRSESNTLSRRYELPTCLLEVWTERSALSDWQSQIVAQNLRFRLQLAQSKKIIKGNQQQITNLIEVVTAYCDRWLAQDDFESLNHVIAVPKLPKLQLSTLQLFDLYESLEICASEFVILPNLVLEVRRLNPNWLKIVAGAIAIMGVSIATIRLISSPFGEQPSYQIASSPVTSNPEKAAIPPSASSENKSDSSSKVATATKPASPINPNAKPSMSEVSPNADIAPVVPVPSPSSKDINRDRKDFDQADKVAIAPEPNMSSSSRQRVTDNLPAIADSKIGASPTPPRRLEQPNQNAAAPPTTVASELAKPAPSAPSAKISRPSEASRASGNTIAANIQVLQIKSELPSDITTDLVRYIQAQSITPSTRDTIAFELETTGDRITNISIDSQASTLKDNKAINELEKLLLNWRSPRSVTGKIRLVLQM